MSNTSLNYQWVLLALTLWREARGCSDDEKRAIAHVIVNRATNPQKRFGKDLVAVLTAPMQFTSIRPPWTGVTTLAEWQNATTWPASADAAWLTCCQIADEIGNASDGLDPTGGATNYYSEPIPHVPSWADPSKQTAKIGVFHFFKL